MASRNRLSPLIMDLDIADSRLSEPRASGTRWGGERRGRTQPSRCVPDCDETHKQPDRMFMMRGTTKRRTHERGQKTVGERSVTVSIERIVPGGMGIGHAERMTVLAPFVAPGDTVRIGVDRVRDNTAFGTVIGVIEHGPNRIAALCPHFGICGGCD